MGKWISSKTCGRGTQTLTRKCDSPTPYCNGKDCSGLNITQNTCHNRCCPSTYNIIILLHLQYYCVYDRQNTNKEALNIILHIHSYTTSNS